VRRTCQQCGAQLYGSARKLCPTCWPITRNAHMRQLGLARAKPKPARPTTEQHSGGITLQQYQTDVLPLLAGIPLPELERATGLSNASCSRLARAAGTAPTALAGAGSAHRGEAQAAGTDLIDDQGPSGVSTRRNQQVIACPGPHWVLDRDPVPADWWTDSCQ